MYSICYTLVEIIRRPPAPSDPTEWSKLHSQFKDDLSAEQIVELMDLMVEATQQMGQPILPLKKLSLLLWKMTLAVFGGFQDAHELKNAKRAAQGLEKTENPMDIIRQLTPVTTQVDVMTMGDQFGENQIMSESSRGGNHRPKLIRDSQKDEDDDEEENEMEELEDERPGTPAPGTMGRGTPRPCLSSSRPGSPSKESEEQFSWTFPYLPWKPKVTLQEMNEYISAARVKEQITSVYSSPIFRRNSTKKFVKFSVNTNFCSQVGLVRQFA